MSYIYDFAKALSAAINAPGEFLHDLEVVVDGALKNLTLSGIGIDDSRIVRVAEIADAIHELRQVGIYQRRVGSGGDTDGGFDDQMSTWSMGNVSYAALGERNAAVLPSAIEFGGDETGTINSTRLVVTFHQNAPAADREMVEAVHTLFTKCRVLEDAQRALADLERKLDKHSKGKHHEKAALYARTVEEARATTEHAEAAAHAALTELETKLYFEFKGRYTRICADILQVLNPEVGSEDKDEERENDGRAGGGGDGSRASPPMEGTTTTTVDSTTEASTVRRGRHRDAGSETSAASTSRQSAHRRLLQANCEATGKKDDVLLELRDMTERQTGTHTLNVAGGNANEEVWSSSGASSVESTIRRNRRNQAAGSPNSEHEASASHISVSRRDSDARDTGSRCKGSVKHPSHQIDASHGLLGRSSEHHIHPEERSGREPANDTAAHGNPLSLVATANTSVRGSPRDIVVDASPQRGSDVHARNPLVLPMPLPPSSAIEERERNTDDSPPPQRQLTAAALAQLEEVNEQHEDDSSTTRAGDDDHAGSTEQQHTAATADDGWFRYYYFDRLKNSAQKVPLLYGLSLDHFQRIAKKANFPLPSEVRDDLARTKRELQMPMVLKRQMALEDLLRHIFQYRKKLEMLRWKLKLVKEAEAKLLKYGGEDYNAHTGGYSSSEFVPAVESATSPNAESASAASLSAIESSTSYGTANSPSHSQSKHSRTSRLSARKGRVNKKKVEKWQKELLVRRADVEAWKEEVFVKGADEMLTFYDELLKAITTMFEDLHDILQEEGPSTKYHSGQFHHRKISFGAAAELLNSEHRVHAPEA